jgi:hypothetical protein
MRTGILATLALSLATTAVAQPSTTADGNVAPGASSSMRALASPSGARASSNDRAASSGRFPTTPAASAWTCRRTHAVSLLVGEADRRGVSLRLLRR